MSIISRCRAFLLLGSAVPAYVVLGGLSANADPSAGGSFPGCGTGSHYAQGEAGGYCFTIESKAVDDGIGKPGEMPLTTGCTGGSKPGGICQESTATTVSKTVNITSDIKVDLEVLQLAAGLQEMDGQTNSKEVRQTVSSPPLGPGEKFYVYAAYRHEVIHFTIRGWQGAPGAVLDKPGISDTWAPTGGIVSRIADPTQSRAYS